MQNQEFEESEVASILSLTCLAEPKLRKDLESREINKVYELFRRALVLRMAIRPEDRLPVDLDKKIDLPSVRRRHWEILALTKRLREYLLAYFARQKVNPFATLELFAEDALLNSKSSISSSCLLKAVEFKEIDRLIDDCLGIRVEEVHRAVVANPAYKIGFKGETLYSDIPPYFLNTSYVDFQAIANTIQMKPGETIVDLGCAIGRMGYLFGMKYPTVNYIGLEVVTERIKEAQRVAAAWNLKNLNFIEQDLSKDDFKMPRAEYYFAYDPVGGSTRDKIFKQFREYAKEKSFKIIAMQGNPGFFDYLGKISWLKETGTTPEWKFRIYAPI
jgi:hypothetical protein